MVRNGLGLAVMVGCLLAQADANAMVDCGRVSKHDRPAKRQRYVVAAIGDSLTDVRVGGGGYMVELAKRCPKSRFDAYGVGGQRTNHMRWRFLHDVFGVGNPRASSLPAYTHVIVLGGVNDLSVQSMYWGDLTSTQKNLSYMYRTARARGVRVIALTIPPWGYVAGGKDRRPAATGHLNDWIKLQLTEGRVDHVVDIHPLLSCGDPDALCGRYRIWPNDAIHWNVEGHDVVADALMAGVFSDCE